MRYNVNDVVYGVYFSFEGIDNIHFRLPYLYDMKEVKAITIFPLTVTEHHKVRNEYDKADAEPSCDGFILKGTDNVVWFNQYPNASYGQLSDEGDRRFYRDHDGLVYDDVVSKGTILECHLLTDVIRNIRKGIEHFNKPEIKAEMETNGNLEELKQRYDLLVKLNEQITTKFNQEFQKDFKESIIWEKHPDITEFIVIDLVQ